MEAHRQGTGHSILAICGVNEFDFICFDCVLNTLLENFDPTTGNSSKHWSVSQRSALSVLHAAPSNQELEEYVVKRYLHTPSPLLHEYLIRLALSIPFHFLQALLEYAIRPSVAAPAAANQIYLLNHIFDRLQPQSYSQLFQNEDILRQIIFLFQRVDSKVGKESILRLLLIALQTIELIPLAELNPTIAQNIFLAVSAYLIQFRIEEEALRIFHLLLKFHLRKVSLWYSGQPIIQEKLVYVVSDLVRLQSSAFSSSIDVKSCKLYLDTIISAVELDDATKTPIFESSNFIPKLIASFIDLGEHISSDDFIGDGDEICLQDCYYKAVARLAKLSPVRVFHFSTFTPFVFDFILRHQIREECIEDTTTIVTLALQHSRAYDQELAILCRQRIPGIVSIDSGISFFWISVIKKLAFNGSLDFTHQILHCIQLIAHASDQITSKTGRSTVEILISLLPQARLDDLFVESNETLSSLIAFLSRISDDGYLEALSNVESILKIHKPALRFLFIDMHWGVGFHKRLCWTILCCKREDVQRLYSDTVEDLLGLCCEGRLITILRRVPGAISLGDFAKRVMTLFEDLLDSETPEDAPCIFVCIYLVAVLDVFLFSIETSVFTALRRLEVPLPQFLRNTILSFLPTPVAAIGCDPFVLLMHKQGNAPQLDLCPMNASCLTFLLCTLHHLERNGVIKLAAPAGFTSAHRLSTYWDSCENNFEMIYSLTHSISSNLQRDCAQRADIQIFCPFLSCAIEHLTSRYPDSGYNIPRCAYLLCA